MSCNVERPCISGRLAAPALRRTRTVRRFGTIAVLMLVVAASMSGCGGDDNNSNGSPTRTPTELPTPPPTQVAGAGLVAEIADVSVASDPAGQVSVIFTLTDGSGIPLTPTSSSDRTDQ